MFVKLSEDQVFPPNGYAILVGSRRNAIYGEDGKPTGQTNGIRLDCRALPDLSPVSVKVLGAHTQAPISNEEVSRRALRGELTWVQFEGFSGTTWIDRRSGTLRISGTASEVRLVDAPNDLVISP